MLEIVQGEDGPHLQEYHPDLENPRYTDRMQEARAVGMHFYRRLAQKSEHVIECHCGRPILKEVIRQQSVNLCKVCNRSAADFPFFRLDTLKIDYSDIKQD